MTFTFKLEQADGTPAEPPSVKLAVPNMRREFTTLPSPGIDLPAIDVPGF